MGKQTMVSLERGSRINFVKHDTKRKRCYKANQVISMLGFLIKNILEIQYFTNKTHNPACSSSVFLSVTIYYGHFIGLSVKCSSLNNWMDLKMYRNNVADVAVSNDVQHKNNVWYGNGLSVMLKNGHAL